MMSKYYTPNIEEFHVGFRYEYAEWWQRDITFVDYHTRTEESRLMWEERKIKSNYTSDGFFKRTVTVDDLSELKQRGLDAQQTFEKIVAGLNEVTPSVRVKYLDKEDIEELRWESSGIKSFKLVKTIELDNNYSHKMEFTLSWGDFEKSIIEILDSNGNILFYGRVNNYNELKKIMKWTGITNQP
jgi:hypothetical protein